MSKSLRQYTFFAEAYDSTSEPDFSVEMAEYVLSQIKAEFGETVNSVLDLSCGVGTACIFFAKNGKKVLGVDLSREMIERASIRAEQEEVDLNLSVQDMRSFYSEERVDLVTSMYDSLNFMLTEDELRVTFERVHAALNENGFFVFDVYTVRGLSELWGTQVEVHTDTEDHFIVSQTSLESVDNICTKKLDGFTKTENGFERWSEVHVSRAYAVEKIREILSQSGFELVFACDWEAEGRPLINEDTRRAVFFTRKV